MSKIEGWVKAIFGQCPKERRFFLMSSLKALCHHNGHLPSANLNKGGGVRGPVAGDQTCGPCRWGSTAVQLFYNPFSQFISLVQLYSQLQLSLWSDPIDVDVPMIQ